MNLTLDLNFSESPSRIGSFLNIFLVGIVGIIALLRVVSFMSNSINQEELTRQFPIVATEFIRTNEFQGRMFNTYNYGGYLIWALPEYPVFVDGRADLHQDEIIFTWYRVINGSEEWKEVFNDWDIQFVLVEPGVPLLAELEDESWTTIYEDDLAVISVSSDSNSIKD